MIYMDKKQSKNGAQFMPYNFLIKSSIDTGFAGYMVGVRTVEWYGMV